MTNTSAAAEPSVLAALVHLQGRALEANTPAVLGFSVVNEALALAPYRQAAFFTLSAVGGMVLTTASGLANVAEDSPYAVWLSRFARTFPETPGCHRLNFSEAAADYADGWEEWLPDHLLVAPLIGPDSKRQGIVMYAREEPWLDNEVALLDRMHQVYGYCLWAMQRTRFGFDKAWRKALRGKWAKRWLIGALVALLIPVRLSALAPAEVVALNALAVAAPQDGVVSTFHVQPNARVKVGDLLFSLDNSALGNRREVAAKSLQVARSDALVAQQKAFDDVKSKAELAAAMGRVREKEAELASIEALRDRVDVKAEREGIAVFSDANEWIGRPVQTGERVMQLADPRDAGVLVWLPVTDALNLEAGASMRLFLHTQPLVPLAAELVETSYQAVQSPENVTAYKLRGKFEADEEKPRIGLRGTARVSGSWAILGYYLFRRPIAAFREWSGL
ncbi:MAG: HlyD family efflux transporter periplasmic adaptor subunit [Pseudomonadota bacterium]